MWHGQLALKNDSASVQMHFLGGSQQLVGLSLAQFGMDNVNSPLRIVQRMRLEQIQLEGVSKKMQVRTRAVARPNRGGWSASEVLRELSVDFVGLCQRVIMMQPMGSPVVLCRLCVD